MKGKTGTQQSWDQILPLRGPLFRLAQRTVTERPQKKVRKKRGAPVTLMNDEQVVAARSEHEFDGASSRYLAEKYGTSLDYMYRLLSYQTRSRLYPEKK